MVGLSGAAVGVLLVVLGGIRVEDARQRVALVQVVDFVHPEEHPRSDAVAPLRQAELPRAGDAAHRAWDGSQPGRDAPQVRRGPHACVAFDGFLEEDPVRDDSAVADFRPDGLDAGDVTLGGEVADEDGVCGGGALDAAGLHDAEDVLCGVDILGGGVEEAVDEDGVEVYVGFDVREAHLLDEVGAYCKEGAC